MALEAIEYQPPREEDEAGDPIGPEPEWQRVAGCKVFPRTSIETGTEVIIDGLGVKAPPPRGDVVPALNARGQVKARGKTWDIDGVPGLFPGKAQLVYLKRVGS